MRVEESNLLEARNHKKHGSLPLIEHVAVGSDHGEEALASGSNRIDEENCHNDENNTIKSLREEVMKFWASDLCNRFCFFIFPNKYDFHSCRLTFWMHESKN